MDERDRNLAQHPRRLNPMMNMPEVVKQVDDMKQKNVINNATRTYITSPVLMVKKKIRKMAILR